MSALRLMEPKVLCKMGITRAELLCRNTGKVRQHHAVPRAVSRRARHLDELQEGFEQPGKSSSWKLAGMGLSSPRSSCGAGDEGEYPCPEHWQLVAPRLRADTWTSCMGWRWINSGWKQSSSSRVQNLHVFKADVEVQLKRAVAVGAGLRPGFAQCPCPHGRGQSRVSPVASHTSQR